MSKSHRTKTLTIVLVLVTLVASLGIFGQPKSVEVKTVDFSRLLWNGWTSIQQLGLHEWELNPQIEIRPVSQIYL